MANHLQSLMKGLDASQLEELGRMWEDPKMNAALDEVLGNYFQPGSGISDGFHPGQTVRIVGLERKRALNGCTGEVLSHDEKSRRYSVQLDSGSAHTERISVKAENLQAVNSESKHAKPQKSSLHKRELDVDEEREISLTVLEDGAASWRVENALSGIAGSGGIVWPSAHKLIDFFKTWSMDDLRRQRSCEEGLRVVELGAGLGIPGLDFTSQSEGPTCC
eukprot:TRINITY_DN114357_c0_g1_i1.p1 TRINITY_DN114357_c0_g1~~TRINITY_DN114357_c0_g1_i1.p1  ORF type:complete len:232 (-),score=36.15 TRINITY_DN114357_c0_g1_i1:36-695(-)